jgi:hypothetical protein
LRRRLLPIHSAAADYPAQSPLSREEPLVSDTIRIQDLTAEEIRVALEEAGVEKRRAVQQFLEEIGGLENARLAIQMLCRIERAA